VADICDYYENEKAKLSESKDNDSHDPLYKNFDKIHTGKILDNLGLRRYCCRRNLISNIDMMQII
jgi:DNA-directed RNA polymerase subunit N (RpoN/RPB10)